MDNEQRENQSTGQSAGDRISSGHEDDVEVKSQHDTEKGKDRQDVPQQGAREGGAQRAE